MYFFAKVLWLKSALSHFRFNSPRKWVHSHFEVVFENKVIKNSLVDSQFHPCTTICGIFSSTLSSYFVPFVHINMKWSIAQSKEQMDWISWEIICHPLKQTNNKVLAFLLKCALLFACVSCQNMERSIANSFEQILDFWFLEFHLPHQRKQQAKILNS